MFRRAWANKALSLFLALVMAMSLVPTYALAESTEDLVELETSEQTVVEDEDASVIGLSAEGAQTDNGRITRLALSKDQPLSSGTAPFDSGDGYGEDSSATNLRVRTNDTITYNVVASVDSSNHEQTHATGRVGFRVSLPNDAGLSLDHGAMQWAQDWTEQVQSDTRTYTFYREIPSTNGHAIPGSVQVPLIVEVGSLPEGYQITPAVEAWCEGNGTVLQLGQSSEQYSSHAEPDTDKSWYEYMPTIAVTTAPALNVVLVGRGTASALNTYVFDDASAYNQNAGTVQGYEATFGVGVEVRNSDLNKAMRGVELPDTSKPISFDIDLKSLYRVSGTNEFKDMTANFTPLLRAFKKNGDDNDYMGDIPFAYDKGTSSVACANTGNVAVTQDGSTLHVTIAGDTYTCDPDKYPSSAPSKPVDAYKKGTQFTDGFFCTYYFTVVLPVKNENKDLQASQGNQQLTVKLDAQVQNLSATSVSGKAISNQTVSTDDIQSVTREMQSTGGNHDHQIFYSRPENWTDGTHSGANEKEDGSDYLAIGSKSAWTIVFSEEDVGSADVGNHVIAFDQLVKFDGNALSVAPSDVGDVCLDNGQDTSLTGTRANTEGNWTLTALYAYKKDGGNWTSDEEMCTANEEDLEYRAAYDAGKVCVGILYQWRGANLGLSKDGFSKLAQTAFMVKNDNRLIDNAYQIVARSNAWTASDLSELAKTALNKSDLTLEEYRNYVQGSVGITAPTHEQLMNTSHSVTVDRDLTYVKASYDGSGYRGGETAGFQNGDTLYVIAYEASVAKSVAQHTRDNQNKPTSDIKVAYDLDNGQRVVDYRIDPKIDFGSGVSTTDVTDVWTTTVTLVDTLLKGLRYLEGTACYTYDVSKYGEAARSATAAGTVEGATSLEPLAIANEDGTTTLTWRIENVSIRDVLNHDGKFPTIFYSCFIGDTSSAEEDVHDYGMGQSLENVVGIGTTDDNRKQTVQNGNLATAKVTWSRLSSFNIYKKATPAIEADGTGEYVVTVNNSSTVDVSDVLAVDLLPANGLGSTRIGMGGSYEIRSAQLDVAALGGASNLSDVEVWYTFDTTVRTQTHAQMTAASVRAGEHGWKKANLDTTTGTIEGFNDTWPVAFAYVDAALPAGRSAKINLTFVGDCGQKGDHLSNALVLPRRELEVDAITDVYTRSIEGMAWLDKNADGTRDTTDTGLSGVEAALYKVVDGGRLELVATTNTDDDGSYSFGVGSGVAHVGDVLHAGTYEVHFSLPNHATCSVVDPVAQDADTMGNKTEPNKTLAGKREEDIVIAGIVLPTIEEMRQKDIRDDAGNHHYDLPHQNVAVFVGDTPTDVVESSETPEAPEDPESPEESDEPAPSELPNDLQRPVESQGTSKSQSATKRQDERADQDKKPGTIATSAARQVSLAKTGDSAVSSVVPAAVLVLGALALGAGLARRRSVFRNDE